MAVIIQAATRVFIYEDERLEDPNPQWAPAQVLESYTAVYPELATAQIEGPEQKGDALEFTFVRSVGKKG